MGKRVWEILGLVFIVSFFVGGCALLDSFFGFNPNSPDGSSGGNGSPASAVGGVLSLWFPWATTAISAIGGIYAEVRRRNWKGAAVSTVAGLEEWFATPEGASVKARILETLSKRHASDGVQATVNLVLESLKKVE